MSAATSHAPAPANRTLDLAPFKGGSGWVMGGGIVGVLLTLVTIIMMATGSKEACFSYLVAFCYWGGISYASVILLMIFHATHARWMTVLRRPVEAMSASVVIFLILFIPVIIWIKQTYIWVAPPASLGRETLKLIAGKAAYLNVKGFAIRGILYFAFAIFVAQRLYGWSLKQDTTGEVMLLQKQRNLSAGGLPFIAMAMTFAAFDWLMSLNPTWFSTIFGVYYFAGSFISSLSLLAIITSMGRSRGVFGGNMNDEHTHNIGKLMLAFTCFWTYIAFSQLLLIWIAGLPEETPFYITRFGAGWVPFGVLLIFGHFFIPFGALLSRSLKRNPRKLAVVAGWLLFIHYIDVCWLILPSLNPDGYHFHWTDLPAFFGVGLLGIAFGVTRLRGKLPVPVKDPYIAESIRYRQP
ncbi:MAG TPA: hypothetical protein VHO06_16125 [Polyangia bacterium]|nr:hypothetical protein [Polyangia bacterium]